jgi:hypothetical protein
MTDLHYLPVSLGEAIDKLSILDIKLDKINDNRRDSVQIEYDLLYKMLRDDIEKYNLFYKIIKIINLEIWDMMNSLRDAEEYNQDYMVLCRECMISNDIRFRIKNKINYISNCELKEQKGYKTMRILFDVRYYTDTLDAINLISPIKYYSFLYDEIIILINKNDEKVFEDEFNYDPTVKIILEPLDIEYKKEFYLNSKKDYALENMYKYLEITEKIKNNYFQNF